MANKFVLIGSGLAGGLLAAYLGRRGYEVELYERRADPREGNIVGGRSINLALSTRGIHALEQLGIADEVLRHAIPMPGRMIHPAGAGGELHFSPYDRDPRKHINSIGRAALNTTVIEAALRHPNVRVFFNHRCTGVDLDTATARLIDSSQLLNPPSPGYGAAGPSTRLRQATAGEAPPRNAPRGFINRGDRGLSAGPPTMPEKNSQFPIYGKFFPPR